MPTYRILIFALINLALIALSGCKTQSEYNLLYYRDFHSGSTSQFPFVNTPRTYQAQLHFPNVAIDGLLLFRFADSANTRVVGLIQPGMQIFNFLFSHEQTVRIDYIQDNLNRRRIIVLLAHSLSALIKPPFGPVIEYNNAHGSSKKRKTRYKFYYECDTVKSGNGNVELFSKRKLFSQSMICTRDSIIADSISILFPRLGSRITLEAIEPNRMDEH